MERRKFVGLGAGVSLAAVLVPRAVAGIGTLLPKGAASIKSDKSIQGRIRAISGDVRIRHPKSLHSIELQPHALYDGSVIEFRAPGTVTFRSGSQLNGLAGQRFKLVCIRDETRAVVRKSFLRAMTLDEVRARIASRATK